MMLKNSILNALKILRKTPHQTNYLRCLNHVNIAHNYYSSQISQNSLQSYLISQIKMKGPITVAEFMKGNLRL